MKTLHELALVTKQLMEVDDASRQPYDSPGFKQYAQQLYNATGNILDAAHDLVRTKYKQNAALNDAFTHKWGVVRTYDQAKTFAGDSGLPGHLIQLDHSALTGHMISHLGRAFNAPDLEKHGTDILALHKHLNFNDDDDNNYFTHMQSGALAALHDDMNMSEYFTDDDRKRIDDWRSKL